MPARAGDDPLTVVVFAGGDAVDPAVAARVPADSAIIAADSGLHHADALGLTVHRVVGDLDSVSPGALSAAWEAGAEVERHEPEKDATDLELALAAALRTGATRLVVVGGGGGRLDHFLANALLLASPALASVEVEALVGTAAVRVVRRRAELQGRPGELLTLLPVHGPATGVRTTGLRYALGGQDLHAGSTRGVSNEFVEPLATVSLEDGVLLAVQPFALSTRGNE